MAAQFQTFTAGATLTAAQVNNYLMKQAVIVCDTSADYPSPVEGMVVYDKALDTYFGYTGAAWRMIATLSAGAVVNVTYTPGGNVDTTATSFTDWLTLGAVTVPSWAIRAKVTMDIHGVYCSSASTYFGEFRAKLGTATGNQTGQIGFIFADARAASSFTIATVITLSGSGSQNLVLQAQRVSGSETLRADSSSRGTAIVEFLGV